MKASQRSQRHREMIGVSKLVDEVLDGYHLTDGIKAHRIKAEWPGIVGKRLAARTWPGTLSEGVLPVRVSNSSWLHQLSFLREELLEQVNQWFGSPSFVREIRFHLGRRDDEDADAPTTPRRSAPRRREFPEPAAGEKLAVIQAETEAIEDPELRALVLEVRRRRGG